MLTCYDARKTWGENQRWEGRAALYVAIARLWQAYGRVCERLGTDRTNDVLDHMKTRILEHGTDEDRADLERAEKEVAERRARKGGRPKADPLADS
ncbi:hypothetical protein [Streptomyces sp. NPDC002671]